MDRNPGEPEPRGLREIQDVSPADPRAPVHGLLAWAAMILVLSVLPVSPGPFSLSDKIIHVGIYVPLGALFFWARPRDSRLEGWAVAALAALGFGFLIEIIQALLPWRSFEWTDAVADLAGGALGAALALCFPRLPLISIFK